MPATTDPFGKIVSTTSSTRWSHTYCAGSLFAVLALTGPAESEISQHGKDIINYLEAEVFALEEKNLAGIKTAIAQSISELPKDISLSFAVGFIKETILYLFVVGGGSVFLKRGDTLGTLLTKTTSDDPIEDRTVTALSGFLHDLDILVLESESCQEILTPQKMTTALITENIEKAAEQLTPVVADKEDGAAAALFILHKAPPKTAVEGIKPEVDTTTKELQDSPKEELPVIHHETASHHPSDTPHRVPNDQTAIYSEQEHQPKVSPFTLLTKFLPKKFPSLPVFRLSHAKKIILSVAIILLFVLGGSILLTVQNKESTKQQALFKDISERVQRDYDEGVSLKSLNKNLAHEDFLKAKKTLEDNKGTFKAGSKEEQDLTALLRKVNDELGGATGAQQASFAKAGADVSALLKIAKSETPLAITRDEKTVFYVTTDGVFKNPAGEKPERIIKNDDDWKDAVGIGTFSGNIYVLDRTNGLLKFVSTSDGYVKMTYFKGDEPDLKTAVSMAIDGSVWILLKNGTVLKYTKGVKDAFSLNVTQSPLAGPSRIVTDADTELLYILDSKGKQIVRFAKNGTLDKTYSADILGNAKELDVNEADKKLFVLSNDTIYELGL